MQSLFGRFIYLPGTLVNQFLGQFLKFLAKSFCDNSCLYVFQDRRGLILLIWMPNHLGGPFSKEQGIFILNLFLCPESGLLIQVQIFVDNLTGILQKHDVIFPSEVGADGDGGDNDQQLLNAREPEMDYERRSTENYNPRFRQQPNPSREKFASDQWDERTHIKLNPLYHNYS